MNQPFRLGFFFVVGLLLIAATLPEFFHGTHVAGSESPVATYSHGVLHVNIPYHGLRSGGGRLILEVLDPENGIVGRSERRVETGNDAKSWQEDVKLAKAIDVDDLVWHRLRYRFAYADGTAGPEGIESISQIIRMPVVHVLGQQSYLAGGLAAVRIIATDSKNDGIVGASTLQIELITSDQKSEVLFRGPLNQRGTAEAQFRLPARVVGNQTLRYFVDTPIGSAELTQAVRLEDKASILLTTEKPLYQPGQTIHVRALALDRSAHEAMAGRKLTFEVEDSRGNKVYRKVTQTDNFGIASAEFGLADEVNLGTYHLRAVMGESGATSPNTAELALNVERYVLPKFKVAIDFSGKDSVAQHGYCPGDHVTGTIRANYFFGKPVADSEVTVKASGMDVTQFDAGSVHGKTDGEGAYHFDLRLPSYFAGRPLEGQVARVLIEATVKDTAAHSETRGEPVTVSESPLIVTAIPEGGTMIPYLENQIFVLTSYADGKPARTTVRVHASGNIVQNAASDEGGVAVVRLQGESGTQSIRIEAMDRQGNQASTSIDLQARDGQDQILLRTERAVYRAGTAFASNSFRRRSGARLTWISSRKGKRF